MLEILDLQFRYPDAPPLFHVARLHAEPGEALALVGPSGCGKTTLLNLIAGILVPQHGSVRVGESMVHALDAQARRALRLSRIGLVFQSFELLEYLNVLDNILLPARLRYPRVAIDLSRRAAELAERMAIGDKLARPVTQLSQGERQRVAVCRALLFDPPLLLADEPTGNLDPRNKQVVLQLLIDEAKRRDSTLLAVTHDHSLLSRFDRVIDFEALRTGGAT